MNVVILPVGVAICAGLASLLGDNVSLGDSSDTGAWGGVVAARAATTAARMSTSSPNTG
jgi:hypothetical protein